MSVEEFRDARASRATTARLVSSLCGATCCSTPTPRSRRSPSSATVRSRSCSSRRQPAARRGRATRSWAPRREPRGGSRTASCTTGRADRGWHNARRPADPLADLETLLRAADPVDAPEIGEFWSGAVGYFGYDVARLIERLPTPPARGVDVPDALFVFTDALVIFDNLRSQARVVGRGTRRRRMRPTTQLDAAYDARHARRRRDGRAAPRSVDARSRSISTRRRRPPKAVEVRPATNSSPTSSACGEYIIAGDAFQVQIARRIDVPFDFSSTDLYRALRVINPSPYMYHLVLDGIGDRRQLARAPDPRQRERNRDAAADRRHAAARADAPRTTRA